MNSFIYRRFFDKVIKAHGCWFWSGAKDKKGYGIFRMGDGRKNTFAHRASYILFIGPIDDKMIICHTCDTPWCVNPDHLFQGTHAENTRDMVEKGRARGGITRGDAHWTRRYPEQVSRGGSNGGRQGVKNSRVKLTEAQVLAIRWQYEHGAKQTDLALQYGVRQGTIGKIVNHQLWSHI